MFQTRGIERPALQKLNRKYGAFGTLILIVPIVFVFVVGSIVITVGEYQDDMKMFAG